MTFSWIDAIALALLAIMFIRGWAAGFIVMAGNLASLVVGVVATAYVFSWLSNWHVLVNWHIAHPVLAIVLFLALLGIIVRVLRLAVRLINALYKVVSILPFMGLLNRLGGGVVGVAEGGVVLLVLVYVIENILRSSGWISFATYDLLESTQAYTVVLAVLHRLSFLFPEMGIWV